MHLSFYRWLNCLWEDFTASDRRGLGRLEVALPVQRPVPRSRHRAWTLQTFDVTSYRNAGMRVRFGFDLTNAVAVSSWNIDDLVVASAPCP